MQRIFDITFSLLAIIFFLPLFIIISLILKMTGEGEILFFQKRVGINSEPFYVWKFVTMVKDSPNIGTGTLTISDDPRILPFGKILRKSKINELPQLFNILKGDMSIIGPRPITFDTYENYSTSTRSSIYSNKPGLSGIGSVVFRNEESFLKDLDSRNLYSSLIGPYKEDLEIWYHNNKSISLYFFLIIATIWVLIRPESKILWRVYKSIPEPKNELKELMGL